MRFSIPICGLGHVQHPNVACFVDYVRAVAAALKQLGHDVVPPTVDGANVDKHARPIVFGAQNMHSVDWPGDPGSFCPDNAILYNSEQTGARGVNPKSIFDAVKTWRTRVVWDYSNVNAGVLRSLGCERVVHCPVGYTPAMTRIKPLPPEDEDIDVLFVGSVATTESIFGVKKSGFNLLDRGQILNDCVRAGLKVKHIFGLYAEDVDPYIARAKIVLNLHYYEGAVFEIFRCSQLLANRKCVITEDGGVDEELEAFAKQAMVYTKRKDVVDKCVELAKALPEVRRAHALRGFDHFTRTNLANNIKRALEQS